MHSKKALFPIVIKELGSDILLKDLHPWNAATPIFVRDSDNLILDNPVQLANALPSILFTESGMIILTIELHCENALFPILVTELPIPTLTREVHLANAFSPIDTTESGIVILSRAEHPSNIPITNPLPISKCLISVIPLPNCTLTKFTQLLNKAPPTEVTESGIIILVIPEPKNAQSSMWVTEEGILTVFIEQ